MASSEALAFHRGLDGYAPTPLRDLGGRGAGLALLGRDALDSLGVAALSIGATVIVAAPVLWLRTPQPTPS